MVLSYIATSCWAHPRIQNDTEDVLKPYRYSPLIIESSILIDEDSVKKSTEQVENSLVGQELMKIDGEKLIQGFLEKRTCFLSLLHSIPEIESFVRSINDKAEEIRRSQDELKESLKEIGAKRGLRKQISIELRSHVVTKESMQFLIDSLRANILAGNKELRRSLVDYVANFNEVLYRLTKAGAKPPVVYTVLAADVEFVASRRQTLKTSESIAIPLDLSPLRLPLATIVEDERFRQTRYYYPPIFLLYNPEASAINLAKPYRTIDGHPIFVRAPMFATDKIRAQTESTYARKDFERSVGPLIYAIKGLAGSRETAPSSIRGSLVEVVNAYLSYNPMSKDLLRIADFGCGTGTLLRETLERVAENDLEEEIGVFAFLNDDSQEDPGRRFRRLSIEERFSECFDSRAWKGDMRPLITDLNSIGERFDIAFINRVLDMYGGYGVFEFEYSPRGVDSSCSSFHETMSASEPTVGDVVVFPESTCHEDAWRAIKYIADRQYCEKKKGFCLLPSVDMKMRKNFFDFCNEDLLDRLLRMAKLLVVSVFPGDFKALFPETRSGVERIFYCEKSSQTSYSIICMSKSEDIIEHIKAKSPDFKNQ